MKVQWDNFDDAPPAKAAEYDRTPLAPGTYWGTINKVEEKSGWRVTDQNPSGDCLSIWVDCDDNGSRKRVFVTVASNWTKKLMAIAECAGVPGPQQGQDDWDEQELVNERVYVQTGTYIPQRGKNAGVEQASIESWVPKHRQPAEAPEAPEPVKKKRTQAGKEWAAFKGNNGGGDDIPFLWLVPLAIAVIGGGA